MKKTIVQSGFFAIPLFFAPLFPWNAYAACDLTINAGNVNINWDLNFDTIAIQFTVTKTNNDACDYGVAFSKGGAADFDSRRVMAGSGLRYQLYKDSGLTKILKDQPFITSVDNVIMDSFPEGINLQHTLTYYLNIPYALAIAPVLTSAGVYTDTFSIYAYEGTDPLAFTPPVTASADVQLTVTVDEIIDLTLTSRGGPFDAARKTQNIGFGLLVSGQSQSLDLIVQANTGYTTSFASANGGKMAKGNSKVSYKFYANGVLLDLSGPAAGPSDPNPTSLQGRAYPLKIVADGVTPLSAVAGEHTDTVTVTVTSN